MRRATSSTGPSAIRSAARSPTRCGIPVSPRSSPRRTATSPRAAELAARADGAADQLGLGCHEPGRIFAGLARLELHLERNDLASAESVLDEVKDASERSHRLTLRSLVGLHEVKLARLRGDEAVARQLLAQARVCFAEPDAAVRRVLDEEAVAQALQFDPSRAGALIAGLDQDRVETGVLRVRLALLEGDDRTAATLLAALPAPTTRRTRVERGIQHALAVLEHDVDGANRHLDEALTLGRPEGLVRAIVEQGPHVHKLLLSCPPDDALASYVEDLLVVTSHMVAPVRVRVAPMLAEPLSDREVTVLRYLCSRLTYREIAAALYVSLNTLKSHVRSVYRKLGVESRQAAVEAGRRSLADLTAAAGTRRTSQRTMRTGHFAWCTMCWLTEPSRISRNPPWPRAPTTSVNAPSDAATSAGPAWSLTMWTSSSAGPVGTEDLVDERLDPFACRLSP